MKNPFRARRFLRCFPSGGVLPLLWSISVVAALTTPAVAQIFPRNRSQPIPLARQMSPIEVHPFLVPRYQFALLPWRRGWVYRLEYRAVTNIEYQRPVR